jgi:hypothetical protein
VGTTILVYDNQLAYFEILKASFSKGYKFIPASLNHTENTVGEIDMILFFVYDEIELIDFVKVYREDIPIVLGLSGVERDQDFPANGNIHYLNLNNLKDEIIEDVSRMIKTVKKKKIV